MHTPPLYDWHLNHWVANKIPWHQKTGSDLLQRHWPGLRVQPGANVLVPLCGKSLDLLWLAKQGYHVFGVELSPIACEDFFRENNLPYVIQPQGMFVCYRTEQITLYCGDFFSLRKEMLPPITAVYDRAALIALPAELRQSYARHLTELLAHHCQLLLIVYDSPNQADKPPYPVSRTEIEKIFAGFSITELEKIINPLLPNHLSQQGYSTTNTTEIVYRLELLNPYNMASKL